MNYSTAVFLINKHVRGIMCSYVPKDDREYKETLFKTLDDTIKLDDYVVVPTDTRHKMTVCKVVAVDVDVDFDSSAPVTWIIGTIDRAEHEKTLAQETVAIKAIQSAELRKKRDELRKSMFAGQVLSRARAYADQKAQVA